MQDRLPLTVRALNWLCKPLTYLGYGKLELGRIMELAKRSVGSSDFGSMQFVEGAEALLSSIRQNKGLHFLGRRLAHEVVFEKLKTRLKIRKVLNENSELKHFVEKREYSNRQRPVFVVGTPRSGTTLLYSLLSLDANSRGPKFWEVVDPAPPACTQTSHQVHQRILYYETRLRRLKKTLPPSWQKIHAFTSANEIEEDFHLLEATFRSPSFSLVYGNANHYRDYLFSRKDDEIIDAYKEFAEMVRLLMFSKDSDSGRYWLSKSPVHAPFAWVLPHVFPNCVIIHTHRDPSQRIPSLCSLVSTAEKMICDNNNKYEIGERVMDYNQRSLDGIQRGRKQAPKSVTLIDVDYEMLKSNPIETVQQIHSKMGLPTAPSFEKTIRDWLVNQNVRDPNKLGSHRYKAGDFGLNSELLKSLDP